MDLKFYLVTSGSTHNSYGLSRYNSILQSFDFIDNHKCYGNIYTNFSYFCYSCCSLIKLPDNLDTSSGTNFTSFCYNCFSLIKLPDNLDTSSGTNFSNFCSSCYSLTKLPDNLDISKGTSFSRLCSNCFSLTKANIILPAAYNITSLNASNKLTVASMRYIADHAPTTSGHTLTIGSTNIARANAYDPTIITTLTGKGWTVN